MKNSYKLLIASMLSSFFVTGCTNEEKVDLTPSNVLYERGTAAFEKGNYSTVISNFTTLDGRFKQGDKSEQVQLSLIYSYYQTKDFLNLLVISDRFLRVHSTSSYIPYVSYMTALANVRLGDSLLQDFLRVDPSQRAQKHLADALEHFKYLESYHIDTKYGKQAKLWAEYILNLQAKHHLNVAKFYDKRAAYVAVANRIESMLADYPNQKATADALVLLKKAYHKMNLLDSEAKVEQLIAMYETKELVNPEKPAYDEDLNPFKQDNK